MKSSAPAESFEKYADDFPSEVKKRLFTLRAIVKELAPEATEKISYRMPAYFLNGRLLYFAAHKNHIGFYPMASGIVMIKDKLQDYVHATGSIQFPHDQPLPLKLVRQIIVFRVKENRAKGVKKKKAS
ncbi:MAG: iron chaperone [Bacteroidota bacterium]